MDTSWLSLKLRHRFALSSRRLGDGGFVEGLTALAILSAITVAFAGVQLLIGNQQKQAVNSKRKLEFKNLVETTAQVLANPLNCAKNFANVSVNAVRNEKSLRTFDKTGNPVFELVDGSGRVDGIQIAEYKFVRIRVIHEDIDLVNLEVKGSMTGDSRQFSQVIPLLVQTQSSRVVKCEATYMASLDKLWTVEEMACRALAQLGVQSKYGTLDDCFEFLAERIRKGEAAPTKIVTAEIETNWNDPPGKKIKLVTTRNN